MAEKFAKPCVCAVIVKTENGKEYMLMQTRQKADGGETNGLLEIPGGKIREYENIFTALRREVAEETGLRVTKIHGEESAVYADAGGNTILSFTPFCITQNLSGAYSIIVHTFLCEAEGNIAAETDEAQNIRWISVEELRSIVQNEPENIFLMHLIALRKYLAL